MNEQQIKNILEGALLAVGRPLALDELAGLFAEDECPERAALHQALEGLREDYAERGFELKEVASGFRLQVRTELSPWISRLWIEKPSRYSRALLETMALVAYRQPITRGEIEDIRGVSVSSSIMKTLQERDWVRVVGHRDVPGRPAMYATTKGFLDYFNLKSLDELPTLAELRDIDSINAELDLGPPDGAPRAVAEDAEYGEDGDAGIDDTAAAGAGADEAHAEASADTPEHAGAAYADDPREPAAAEQDAPVPFALPAEAADDGALADEAIDAAVRPPAADPADAAVAGDTDEVAGQLRSAFEDTGAGEQDDEEEDAGPGQRQSENG